MTFCKSHISDVLDLESGEWTFQEATAPSPQKLSEKFRLIMCPSVLLVISK